MMPSAHALLNLACIKNKQKRSIFQTPFYLNFNDVAYYPTVCLQFIENVKMSEVDRPIKPDQKYLEEYLQRINRVEVRPFLRKGQKGVLPCYLNKNAKPEVKEKKEVIKKTKAQIYEQIKEKNLKKFGQKKLTVNIEQPHQTINPKKMTINYKPKPHIQTQQYKKKDHIPIPKSSHAPLQSKQKIEYQKLIDYFNKEMKDLQREKQEFGKVAEKLRFKESIRKEEGLFYSRVKSQVQKRFLMAQSEEAKSQQENIRTNIQSREKPNYNAKITKHPLQPHSPIHENLSKTYSVGDIRNRLTQTCQQMQAIKTQMLHHNLQITQHKYEIYQAHLLPNFEPQAIYDYIDLRKLRYNGNSLYQAALNAFNSKFQKDGKHSEDLCSAEQSSLKPKIKEKYIGDKRVSKYSGWIEVWIAGKQRLMTNPETNYKVIWLSNGDVLQEFSTGIKTYYSKVKEICKIQYKDPPVIYYHQKLKQIWRYLPNNTREVVFQNGRAEIIEERA